MDSGLTEMGESHAGGLQHRFLRSPVAKEGFPILVWAMTLELVLNEGPLLYIGNISAEGGLTGDDFLQIDSYGHRRDDSGDIAAVMRNGPMRIVEGDRSVATIFPKRTERHAARRATHCQRFPRASALRRRPITATQQALLRRQRQDDGINRGHSDTGLDLLRILSKPAP